MQDMPRRTRRIRAHNQRSYVSRVYSRDEILEGCSSTRAMHRSYTGGAMMTGKLAGETKSNDYNNWAAPLVEVPLVDHVLSMQVDSRFAVARLCWLICGPRLRPQQRSAESGPVLVPLSSSRPPRLDVSLTLEPGLEGGLGVVAPHSGDERVARLAASPEVVRAKEDLMNGRESRLGCVEPG